MPVPTPVPVVVPLLGVAMVPLLFRPVLGETVLVLTPVFGFMPVVPVVPRPVPVLTPVLRPVLGAMLVPVFTPVPGVLVVVPEPPTPGLRVLVGPDGLSNSVLPVVVVAVPAEGCTPVGDTPAPVP
jgi:hypothetical protein